MENFEGGTVLPLSEIEQLNEKLESIEMNLLGATGEDKEKLEMDKATIEEKISELSSKEEMV